MEEEDEFLYGGGSNDSKTAPVRKEPTKEADGEDEVGSSDESDFEVVMKSATSSVAPNTSSLVKSLHLTKTSAPNAAASSATGQANTIDSIHKIDLNAVGQIGGKDVYDHNLDSYDDKPWKKPGADITDYFNFGFNETSWKTYASKQKMIRSGQMGHYEDMSLMMAAMAGGMSGYPILPGQGTSQDEASKFSSSNADAKRGKRKVRPQDSECVVDLSAKR